METVKDEPAITVGLDLGDRYSHYGLLNEEVEVVEDGRIQSTEAAFQRHFEGEACQESPWSAAGTRRGSAGCSRRWAT